MESDDPIIEESTFSIKCSLWKFCKEKDLIPLIQEKVSILQKIATESMQLMNLHIRFQYEEALRTNTIPFEKVWNQSRVLQYLYAVSESNRSAKVDYDILSFRNIHYLPLRGHSKFECRNGIPGNSIKELATRMATAIQVNIQEHFSKRQIKYIRLKYNCDRKEAIKKQRALIEEADKTKKSLDDSLPAVIQKSVYEDLKCHPENFLWPMWKMNYLFAQEEKKTFALLPLSHGFITRGCLHLDTDALQNLLPKSGKKKEYLDLKKERIKKEKESVEETVRKKRKPGRKNDEFVMAEKDFIWEEFFKIEHLITKSRKSKGKCRFGHHMVTDGISVSAQFLKLGGPKKKKTKKIRKLEKKSKNVDSISSLRKEEIDEKRVVGVDPGKHIILHLTNETISNIEERKTLSYTAKQRRHESHIVHRRKTLEKKKEKEIQELEDLLSKTNSKSPTTESFKNYLSTRFRVQDKLYDYYSNFQFRIYRWWNWRDRRKSEDRFISKIGRVFGNDVVLAYGNWSSWHGMKGVESSPTGSLRRRIAKKYQVINTPEYFTSKTCSKCHHELIADNQRLLKKTKKPLRSIRRCTSEICGGFRRWNRDHNAAINIRTNLLHFLEKGMWHPKFTAKS